MRSNERGADPAWLEPATWARLRTALDDGVASARVRERFGISSDALAIVRGCRTSEEAREALAAKARRTG